MNPGIRFWEKSRSTVCSASRISTIDWYRSFSPVAVAGMFCLPVALGIRSACIRSGGGGGFVDLKLQGGDPASADRHDVHRAAGQHDEAVLGGLECDVITGLRRAVQLPDGH